MVSGANHSRISKVRTQAEQDLLNLLLQSEGTSVQQTIEDVEVTIQEEPSHKIAYPWNPDQSPEFFAEIESNHLLHGLDDQEITERAETFFTTLDHLWDTSLQAKLTRKFAMVPKSILVAIAQRAEVITQQAEAFVSSSSDFAGQLVQCVQTSLPLWSEEDLYVFARPVAYAMRGEEPKYDFPQDWQALSEIDQAKLTLAIAKYALNLAQQEQD
ncbi:hypothetical protein [Alkalinema sp. FACHB-956]|uniref:hypothetical protein n=1 Tax=Alkalinema sp. FACHB-956 TaxID=2692768 RepID=UPI00168200C6|nr:hypothetical protein [Alkalinema sp. FACHB-956]MBD2328269.1 hypothetical protein [Alkalinema sp. FACHB-956]